MQMTCSPEASAAAPSRDVPRLEAILRQRFTGRLYTLRVIDAGAGVVLRGRAPTYYLKQLAQHALLQLTDLPLLANEIEVS